MRLGTDTGNAMNQAYRYPFSTFLSAIFALLFFTVGNAFILYGLNKGREIGGRAAMIVFIGLPFFFIASWFFLEGILGWNI